mmetsp:Transcript_504/g.1006  ORF Transcript_504/g.1006 Transcript_504/m.1006 type:complete len:224 (-) Transcript_504:1778-2449(-)
MLAHCQRQILNLPANICHLLAGRLFHHDWAEEQLRQTMIWNKARLLLLLRWNLEVQKCFPAVHHLFAHHCGELVCCHLDEVERRAGSCTFAVVVPTFAPPPTDWRIWVRQWNFPCLSCCPWACRVDLELAHGPDVPMAEECRDPKIVRRYRARASCFPYCKSHTWRPILLESWSCPCQSECHPFGLDRTIFVRRADPTFDWAMSLRPSVHWTSRPSAYHVDGW